MRIVRSAALAALLDALAALKFGAAAALLWACGRGAAARSLLGAWTVRSLTIAHPAPVAPPLATVVMEGVLHHQGFSPAASCLGPARQR